MREAGHIDNDTMIDPGNPVGIGIYEEFIEKGLSPCGPSREVYLNDPHEVPESELLTEVQIPVK